MLNQRTTQDLCNNNAKSNKLFNFNKFSLIMMFAPLLFCVGLSIKENDEKVKSYFNLILIQWREFQEWMGVNVQLGWVNWIDWEVNCLFRQA